MFEYILLIEFGYVAAKPHVCFSNCSILANLIFEEKVRICGDKVIR